MQITTEQKEENIFQGSVWTPLLGMDNKPIDLTCFQSIDDVSSHIIISKATIAGYLLMSVSKWLCC